MDLIPSSFTYNISATQVAYPMHPTVEFDKTDKNETAFNKELFCEKENCDISVRSTIHPVSSVTTRGTNIVTSRRAVESFEQQRTKSILEPIYTSGRIVGCPVDRSTATLSCITQPSVYRERYSPSFPKTSLLAPNSLRSSPAKMLSGKLSSGSYGGDSSHRFVYGMKEKHSTAMSGSNHDIATDAIPVPTKPNNFRDCASGEHRPEDYYIRRAQERIARQRPDRRPRLKDLMDKQAEDLVTAISLSFISTPPCEDGPRASAVPCVPNELKTLTDYVNNFNNGLLSSLAQTPSSQPRWSSGWDDVFNNPDPDLAAQEAESKLVIHAPRAVRSIKVVELLELLVEENSL
ncbi:hypothetical protein F5050DRAFT_1803879 [Lentinula boryana]|uniref:Uncharacterized protein n=1 Tax=Lentinula boryana TaxID=40481 RepID=A0ABQ8QQK3_9AGAR|nr:hypothetical protein F5050DRAFT_1803879 [Lentinula boryana]